MSDRSLAETPRGGSGEMFDAIASLYDRMNRLLSLGLDQRWRRAAVRALELERGARVLDVATGTGDLAILLAQGAPGVRVTGIDPSRRMLEIGQEKVRARGMAERIELTTGDGERLPFEDASFDRAAVAFGIRNIPDRVQALREMARVVRPGGRIAILELTEPRRGFLRALARLHIRMVVPLAGALVAHGGEYRYLEESIARFPDAEVFEGMMRAAGLEVLPRRTFVFGAVTLFVGASRGAGAR